MERKCALFMLVLAATVLFVAGPCATRLHAGEHKVLNDMCGNVVEVPVNPKRIASMHCVSSERIYILGQGERLCLMGKQSPWAYRLFPEIRNVPTVSGSATEQIREVKPDLVLHTTGMFKGKGEELKAAGFTTVCAFTAEKRARTVDDFIAEFKRQMRFYGDLLGPAARARADRYCAYFDRKIKAILAITSKIGEKDRPSVYYGWKGGKPFSSQGAGSTLHWDTEIAGGTYLPQVKDDNFAELDKRLVLSWDPDVILISRGNVTVDSVKKDPDWTPKKAVRNGKVFSTPEGIYSWDNASGETVLFIIYLAKIFHPDLFRGWDMKKEMQAFYSEVYGRAVTDTDAERILRNLPPSGSDVLP